MYSSRLISVLVVVVSILCMAQATWWDNQKVHHRGLIRRADSLSGALNDLTGSPSPSSPPPASSTPSAAPAQSSSSSSADSTSSDEGQSSTSAPPSSTPPPDSSSSTTPAPGGTTSSPSSTSAGSTTAPSDSTTPSASAPSTTPPPQSTSSSDKGSSDNKTSAGGDDKDGSSDKSEQQTTYVSTKVEVVVKTNSDGSKQTQTTTTRTTETAALNAENSKATGMSVQTRNTIIGVVVGVGGAIILGTLILVAFRVWGRKKHAEEADGLMAYNADIVAAEKSPRGSSSGGQRNPFQSTLENYHQPVNASANF
ncbi:hypothetical protein CFAM422_004584 [Trichoderma lentiforme]|uniref:Mid2 domain-containing protein n=1 Tax=Trichoderma lentiforme TaxID=1567552 RepID=A0A9P4XFQ1_9HYPO|nr:hypothetical protein CFAM422_004584 [Trichoderma lentiforme]